MTHLQELLTRYACTDVAVIMGDILMLITDGEDATVSEKICAEFGYDSEIASALLNERALRLSENN